MQIKSLPEKTVALTMTAGTGGGSTQNVIQSLLNDRYLHGYDLVFRGRLAIGVAVGTAVLPEAPQNIFRRVRVEIHHTIFGTQSIIDLPGATLFQRAKLFNKLAPHTFGTALGTAVGNYDIGVVLPLIFPLENVVEQQEFQTLLDAVRTSSIQIFLDMAPGADLVTPGGTTTFTWTAYGSGAGNPTVDVVQRVVNGLSHLPETDLVLKHDRVDGLNNAVALTNPNGQYLPRGNDIRLIGLKQYTASANGIDVVSAALNPIVDTDNGIAHPQILVGKTPIRDYPTWQALVAENKMLYGIAPDSGYGIVDFVNRGSRFDALAASRFAINQKQWGYGGLINAAGASSQVEVFFDEILSHSDFKH